MIMASEFAGGDNNQTCKESELLSVSLTLALALKEDDTEKFLQIYDSSIPPHLGKTKVDEIKERARELSERSTVDLESLRADLQAGQNLISDVFHNVRVYGTFDAPEKNEKGFGSKDRNHNLSPHLGSTQITPAMTLKTDEKDDNASQAHETDLGAVNTITNNVPKGQFSESQKRYIVDEDAPKPDSTMSESKASGVAGQKGQQEVDDGIQFGPLTKTKETTNDVMKGKTNMLREKTNKHNSETKVSTEDVGPIHPEILLKKSASLILKPKSTDVKNCPAPELINSSQVTEFEVNAATPILGQLRTDRGNKSPLKRHGAQQKERELEDVYAHSSPAVSPTGPSFHFDNGFQTNYGSCRSLHETSSNKATRDDSSVGDGTRKKKRKKKKKTKQDNGTESTTEGEEARSPNDLTAPSSADTNTKRKTSAESSSERENLSGENDGKVFPGQKAKHSKDNKGNRTKAVEPVKNNKPVARKKKGNEETSSEGRKWSAPENEIGGLRQLTKDEENEEQQQEEELEEDVFASLRRRAIDDATNYGKDESEADCRAAMSDPGENDEEHGGFNIVKYRKSRRKEKGASHFGFPRSFSKNFYMDDSPNSNFARSKDSAWDLRKSSSLPKEMCKYTNSRRRLGTNEAEEQVSTTTTTTTASSRRDSLESDENSFEQKKQGGLSYASRLKASIQGTGHVQLMKEEEEKEPSNNLEGITAPLSSQSNSKPKINSIGDLKSDTVDRTVSQQESKELTTNVPPSSSISAAMNLEVSPTRKFDLNFPNLTSYVASSTNKRQGSSEHQAKSVQYLNLECTKISYAGRVKQSLGTTHETTTTTTASARDDQSIRTVQKNEKSTIEGFNLSGKETVKSSSQDVCASGKDGKIGTIEFGQTKAESYNLNLPLDNQKSGTTLDVETVCKVKVAHAEREKIEAGTTSGQSLPSNSGVLLSNPIWFGSLIVSEDGILDLDEYGRPESFTRSKETKLPTAVVVQGALINDYPETDEAQTIQAANKSGNHALDQGHVANSKQGQDMTERDLVADNTVEIKLLSSKKLKLDISSTSLKTKMFNLSEVTEMLLKDWEATMKQSQDDPDSVFIVSE